MKVLGKNYVMTKGETIISANIGHGEDVLCQLAAVDGLQVTIGDWPRL